MALRKLGKRTGSGLRLQSSPTRSPRRPRLLCARSGSGAHRRSASASARHWSECRSKVGRQGNGSLLQPQCTPISSPAFRRSSACTSTTGPNATEHFRLVLGYDAKTDEVIFHDPAVADGAYHRMKRPEFIKLWPLKYASDAWTVVRFRLEPSKTIGSAPAASDPRFAGSRFTAADYAQHILALKKQLLPNEDGFTVVIQPPFVVIGDESADTRSPPRRKHSQVGRRSHQAIVFPARSRADSRHLAVQGQSQLREERQRDLRRQADHALRILFGSCIGL